MLNTTKLLSIFYSVLSPYFVSLPPRKQTKLTLHWYCSEWFCYGTGVQVTVGTRLQIKVVLIKLANRNNNSGKMPIRGNFSSNFSHHNSEFALIYFHDHYSSRFKEGRPPPSHSLRKFEILKHSFPFTQFLNLFRFFLIRESDSRRATKEKQERLPCELGKLLKFAFHYYFSSMDNI